MTLIANRNAKNDTLAGWGASCSYYRKPGTGSAAAGVHGSYRDALVRRQCDACGKAAWDFPLCSARLARDRPSQIVEVSRYAWRDGHLILELWLPLPGSGQTVD
jgi:hypothetical protein